MISATPGAGRRGAKFPRSDARCRHMSTASARLGRVRAVRRGFSSRRARWPGRCTRRARRRGEISVPHGVMRIQEERGLEAVTVDRREGLRR